MKLLTENKKLNSELSSRKKKKKIIRFEAKPFQLRDGDKELYSVLENLKT